MEEYMLPIKTLKIHIDNHSEIPYQTLKKKIAIINFIKKTHAMKSMSYKE